MGIETPLGGVSLLSIGSSVPIYPQSADFRDVTPDFRVELVAPMKMVALRKWFRLESGDTPPKSQNKGKPPRSMEH